MKAKAIRAALRATATRAAACGYMAGLVGSSSSPISGVGIVSIVIISLVLLLVGESGGLMADEANRKFLLALTLFCGASVICVASISNDNLQVTTCRI